MNLPGRFKDVGLRAKFLIVISLLTVVSSVLVSSYLIYEHIDAAKRGLIMKGSALIKVLATNCEYGTVIENEAILDELITATAQADDIIYIIVQNVKGDILAAEATQEGLDPAALPSVATADSLVVRQMTPAGQKNYCYELSYPVVTSRGIISREMLGEVGKSRGKVVTEIIGTVRLGISVSATVGEATKNIRAAVIIILVVTGITILLTFWFVRLIVKPIEQLARATEKIAQGDLSLTTGLDRRDEIGQLASSFDSMVGSLKESRAEIERYNRTLEEKIIDRTRELEQAQSQLIQSEKMAAVGQLSAGVAHELNNPLGGILGYAQYTLEKMCSRQFSELTEKDFESYKKHLRDIETQSRRCKTIVQNLLKFSRSTSKVDFTEIDVNAVLVETISLVEHQMTMHKVTLTTDLQQNAPPVRGNAGMLQQVFTNVIINALHAMADGGNLIVTSRYSAGLGEFSGAIEISFNDTGCGIPPEIQRNIFEPFFTTKPIGKGTGLGLSVSYGIIKEHGGEIKVESVVGCGTTFVIILPLEKIRSTADTPEGSDRNFIGEQV